MYHVESDAKKMDTHCNTNSFALNYLLMNWVPLKLDFHVLIKWMIIFSVSDSIVLITCSWDTSYHKMLLDQQILIQKSFYMMYVCIFFFDNWQVDFFQVFFFGKTKTEVVFPKNKQNLNLKSLSNQLANYTSLSITATCVLYATDTTCLQHSLLVLMTFAWKCTLQNCNHAQMVDSSKF